MTQRALGRKRRLTHHLNGKMSTARGGQADHPRRPGGLTPLDFDLGHSHGRGLPAQTGRKQGRLETLKRRTTATHLWR